MHHNPLLFAFLSGRNQMLSRAPSRVQRWLSARSRCAAALESMLLKEGRLTVGPLRWHNLVNGKIQRQRQFHRSLSLDLIAELEGRRSSLVLGALVLGDPVMVTKGTHKDHEGVLAQGPRSCFTPKQAYVKLASGTQVRVAQTSLQVHPDTLERGRENLSRVVSLPEEACMQYASDAADSRLVAILRLWRDVSRGKDLFIRGLGGFDVGAVYDSIAASEQDKLFKSARDTCPLPLKTNGYIDHTELPRIRRGTCELASELSLELAIK